MGVFVGALFGAVVIAGLGLLLSGDDTSPALVGPGLLVVAGFLALYGVIGIAVSQALSDQSRE